MSKKFDRELLADVAERLITHLQTRTDVQNIDLMNLSGFCRNCLSKWYLAAAEKKNISLDYNQSRELVMECHTMNGKINIKKRQPKNN